MNDIWHSSEVEHALLQAVQIISRQRILGLSVLMLENGKQVRASVLTTDGLYHLTGTNIDGNIEWARELTGKKRG